MSICRLWISFSIINLSISLVIIRHYNQKFILTYSFRFECQFCTDVAITILLGWINHFSNLWILIFLIWVHSRIINILLSLLVSLLQRLNNNFTGLVNGIVNLRSTARFANGLETFLAIKGNDKLGILAAGANNVFVDKSIRINNGSVCLLLIWLTYRAT